MVSLPEPTEPDPSGGLEGVEAGAFPRPRRGAIARENAGSRLALGFDALGAVAGGVSGVWLADLLPQDESSLVTLAVVAVSAVVGAVVFWGLTFIWNYLVTAPNRVIAGLERQNDFLLSALADRQREQAAIDQLSRLKSESVQLYVKRITAEELGEWTELFDAWHEEVLVLLQQDFEESVWRRFRDLGPIDTRLFEHEASPDHRKQLAILTKKMSILDRIIGQHEMMFGLHEEYLREAMLELSGLDR